MADLRFHKQLGQQLTFVENSCSAYDRGQTHEAIRIATSLRILLHDTRSSTSLLTHLGSKDVLLLSTCAVRTEIPYGTVFDGLSGFSGAGIRAKLGHTSTKIQMPAADWWEQLVIGLGQGRNLSRRIITLTAANKDGGAHVDEELPEEYELLIRGVWETMSGGKAGPVPDHHLLYLRQMGYEILNSPQLVALAA